MVTEQIPELDTEHSLSFQYERILGMAEEMHRNKGKPSEHYWRTLFQKTYETVIEEKPVSIDSYLEIFRLNYCMGVFKSRILFPSQKASENIYYALGPRGTDSSYAAEFYGQEESMILRLDLSFTLDKLAQDPNKEKRYRVLIPAAYQDINKFYFCNNFESVNSFRFPTQSFELLVKKSRKKVKKISSHPVLKSYVGNDITFIGATSKIQAISTTLNNDTIDGVICNTGYYLPEYFEKPIELSGPITMDWLIFRKI